MFNFFKRKPKESLAEGMRDLLFADAGWSAINGDSSWEIYGAANQLRLAGKNDEAVGELKRILSSPDLESRQVNQTWCLLRELGEKPDENSAQNVLGTIIEMGMPQGLEVLAAFADGRVRYYDCRDNGFIWEHPNDSLDDSVKTLLQVSRETVSSIGPWEGARPPAVKSGYARLNMLTPSGLHFGEGPIKVLSEDPLGAPILFAGIKLLERIVEIKTK